MGSPLPWAIETLGSDGEIGAGVFWLSLRVVRWGRGGRWWVGGGSRGRDVVFGGFWEMEIWFGGGGGRRVWIGMGMGDEGSWD